MGEGKQASAPSHEMAWGPAMVMIVLSLTWGANLAAVKIGGRELPPFFMAGVRSAIAALGLWVWMLATGVKVFPRDRSTLHGAMLGLLFGAEFGLLYLGLTTTSASRAYVLLYTAPFFVALGAHFFLAGDRLNRNKVGGLVLAFGGVVTLFLHQMGGGAWQGDLLALAGGALWGATTIYLKRFLAARAHPLQTLFHQVFFSAPLLFAFSLMWSESLPSSLSLPVWGAVLYQGVIVAFLSYLVWFHLIHRYPVTLLHAFSFLTPVAGVFISGYLILGEPMSPRLFIALGLVCLGLVLVNRHPKAR